MNRCGTCAYWSELVAKSEGCGPIEALCENYHPNAKGGQYTVGSDTCRQWSGARPEERKHDG